LFMLPAVVMGIGWSGLTVNTTVLDNNPGLDTTNITINGIQYPEVMYVNITTGERAAIDVGYFTIPSGCYPCLGESYCVNIYQPYLCEATTGCFWTEESEECEGMFPNATVRDQHCKECQQNGQDYCIVEDMCVPSSLGACLNVHDQVTVSTELADLGISTVCDFPDEIVDDDIFGVDSSTTSSVLDLYQGIFIVSGILVCLIFGCAISMYRERRELNMFQVNNYREFRQNNIIEVL